MISSTVYGRTEMSFGRPVRAISIPIITSQIGTATATHRANHPQRNLPSTESQPGRCPKSSHCSSIAIGIRRARPMLLPMKAQGPSVILPVLAMAAKSTRSTSMPISAGTIIAMNASTVAAMNASKGFHQRQRGVR